MIFRPFSDTILRSLSHEMERITGIFPEKRPSPDIAPGRGIVFFMNVYMLLINRRYLEELHVPRGGDDPFGIGCLSDEAIAQYGVYTAIHLVG